MHNVVKHCSPLIHLTFKRALVHCVCRPLTWPHSRMRPPFGNILRGSSQTLNSHNAKLIDVAQTTVSGPWTTYL